MLFQDDFINGDNDDKAHWLELITGQREGMVVMQFTGLKDKTGKEIYEGDIVEADSENGEVKGIVRWDGIRAAFYIRFGEYDLYFPSGPKPERFIVIGSIYENPELLKL